jgi:hemoglobin/transferrin/lactoferrin receptor protein
MISMAAFTLHTFDLPKWTITAGVRYNAYLITIEDVTLGKIKLAPSAVVGNLAILRKLCTTSSLFASVNTGFRAPNIDDMGTLGIVDFRYEKPNFALKPEHSRQIQLGYKYLNRKLRGEFYLYRNVLNDLIVRRRIEGESIEGYPVYLKENLEKACIQGIETAWSYTLSRSWSFSGTLTYTYGQSITLKEPLRRIPPVFGNLTVEYTSGKFGTSIEWLAAGKQDRLAAGDRADNRIPQGGTPGWNLFNIHTRYTWSFISVNLSIQNLFNKDYRYHGSGVNGYGRSAWLSIMLSL